MNDIRKKIFGLIERRFSFSQFGENAVELAKKYPDMVRYIVITYDDWVKFKEEVLRDV